jgi:hypothetical protein
MKTGVYKRFPEPFFDSKFMKIFFNGFTAQSLVNWILPTRHLARAPINDRSI